jgi:hypothetical protein
VRPSRTQLRREYREFVASAAPVARPRLAGAASAGSAADSEPAVYFAAPVESTMSAYSEEACSEEACSEEAYSEEAFAGPVGSSAVD